MVSISMDGESLQNLLSVYENAGYHDFGTTDMLENTKEVKSVNKYYFYNFKMDLSDDDLGFSMDGTLDANARVVVHGIPFHPRVRTSGINASANSFFKDFGISEDGNVHLNVCISDVNANISDISYGKGFIVNQFMYKMLGGADGRVNSEAKSAIDKAITSFVDASNCIDITNHVAISYPEFLSPIGIQHAGTKVADNKISAYGCPVAKIKVGDAVVIGDGSCETVAYNIAVYTADDVGNAGTESKISFSLCGDDAFGGRRCIDGALNDWTKKGQISHLLLESSALLVDNLSLSLISDNSGSKPGWYVDSVSVDMTIPNNSTFHYWFPIHRWIGGSNRPTSFTFHQADNPQIYTFTVKTGSGSRFETAGTDSHILADACDVNGKCLTFLLDKDGHDDFEKGSTSTYTIVTNEKMANLKSLTLHNVYDESRPDWYVQDVMYSHYSFPESKGHSLKDGQGFMFRQWLAEGENQGAYYTTDRWNYPVQTSDEFYLYPVNADPIFFIRDISATRYVNDNFGYNVRIKTKSGGASGTDADIALTLVGCSGVVETFDLNDDKDNFEKGDEDVFLLSGIKDLKGIKKVSLHNDGSGDGAGWSPESLSVIPVVYGGIYALPYNAEYRHEFTRGLNKNDGWDWESEELSCPDMAPQFIPYVYEVHPGEYLNILGKNLKEAQNISLVLNKTINPVSVDSRNATFYIPEDTPLGEYNLGSVLIDGVVQQVFVHVRGEKPVLDGIAVFQAKPGDGFEVSMRNVDSSSRFYLGNRPLQFLAMSKKGVYLQIPNDMENGIYKFRTQSNGWDITFNAAIEIVKSTVPHILGISDSIVYSGQTIEIFGKNFGDSVNAIEVKFGEKTGEVRVVENEKLQVQIPYGVSGDSIWVRVSREGIWAPEVIKIKIQSLPWFMTFDDVENSWTSGNASLSLDSAVKYGNVGYSLKIHGSGYMPIISPVFNTYELGAFSDTLLLDVWIPENQANPYWWGDVQMSVNIPAAGVYNAWIGQKPLTDLHPGWNTLAFALNSTIYSAFAGDYPNATISVILNVNENTDDFRIDNLRFGGDIKIRRTEHIEASPVLNVYAVDFMSFDNINDWSSSGTELLFVDSPKMQGLGATGIMASGYTEIESRRFLLSELQYVSDVISLDVYVPNPQPNDYWVGNLGMGLRCFDSGISMYLGNVDLTHLFREEFNNVRFTLPPDALQALKSDAGECSFSVYLNVNNGAGLFLLDNMGFVKKIEVAGR
ncbi:PLAT/LH2 domain-containing protein [uncultured Fibrobacter sp.]|uniref:PLAT/LH2 domain-containing protein n=1 Tax=uncultured Fibrobacter sp. TaxID=261512 RepID=UPI0028045E12|nr:PLAT/LH2 domain-containing protein [uncultured Fibrobacter sp.]